MRPDFIYCGSCFHEFRLSDLTYFIEHKKSDCSIDISDGAYPPGSVAFDEFQCFHCLKNFHTVWPLLAHVQSEHGLKVLRNLESEKQALTSSISSGLETPDVTSERFNSDSFNIHVTEQDGNRYYQTDRFERNNIPKWTDNVFSANPLADVNALTPDDVLPSVENPPDYGSCSTRNNDNAISANSLSFCHLSYKHDGLDVNNFSKIVNLEDSLRLIHKIACSNMLSYGTVSATKIHQSCSKKNLSSYALSLSCCQQSRMTCLCTVCECSSIDLAAKTKSISCQTDDSFSDEIFDVTTNDMLMQYGDEPQEAAVNPSQPMNVPTPNTFFLDKVMSERLEPEKSVLSQMPFTSDLEQISTQLPVSVAQPGLVPTDITGSSLPVVTETTQVDSLKPIPFRCSFCGRLYRQKIHLQKHVMSQHTKEKPFYCPQCTYSTVEKSHLTVHIRTHTGERPFSCRECKYSSAQNCTLKTHYLRRHPGSRVSCEKCGSLFVTELECVNHLKNCETGISL